MKKLNQPVDAKNPDLKENVQKSFKQGIPSSEMITGLKTAGFNFNQKDEEGTPLLTLATQNNGVGRQAYGELLTAKNLDLKATDANQKSASDYADGFKSDFLEKALRESAPVHPCTVATQSGIVSKPENSR